MTTKATKDAALSRLFGGAAEDEAGEITESKEAGTDSLEAAPAQAASSAEAPGLSPRPAQKASVPSSTEKGYAPKSDLEVGEKEVRSGYIGLGRYMREDGILERITPYVRPDQAEALRVAVARKRDPRGRDISQIIQSLLDEAGYSDKAE